MKFAIVVAPNKRALVVDATQTVFSLQKLQVLVGGMLQPVQLPRPFNRVEAYVDEESLLRALEFNPLASAILQDHIVGPLVIIAKGERQALDIVDAINAFYGVGSNTLHENPRPFKRPLNDEDRAEWIDNDEGLYNWWVSSKLSKKSFIKKNKTDIDTTINNLLEGNLPKDRQTISLPHNSSCKCEMCTGPTLHENPRARPQSFPIHRIKNSSNLLYRGYTIKMWSEGGYWIPSVDGDVLGAFPTGDHGYSAAAAAGMSAIDNKLGKYYSNPENGGLSIILAVATIGGLAFGGWWLYNKYNAPGGSLAITLSPGNSTQHGFQPGGSIALGLPANALNWYSLSVDGNASVASPTSGVVPITVYPGNPNGTITASWLITPTSTPGIPSMSNPIQTATIAYGA